MNAASAASQQRSDGGPEPSDEPYVLDVSSYEDGLRAFCPLAEDGNILVGLTLLTDLPPGPVVGVFHIDGPEAVEAWCAAHPDLLLELGLDAVTSPADPDPTPTLGARLEQLAEAIERDRREPDKILLYVADLRRIAVEDTLDREDRESRHRRPLEARG